MAAKFYAVKKGSLTGIFRTWDECRACVEGYPGPIYKSFTTLEEAARFMGWVSEPSEVKNTQAALESDVVPIYVDGSFHSATGEFSYGMVVLVDGAEETFKDKFDDPELATMHNVAGEIKGAQAAMQYALDKGIGKIAIFHDYEGIAKWCTGEWKTNKEGTKAYKAFYDEVRQKIEIQFVKVAGHTGDKYNEMADKLAKEALGII
ncbi:MAG: ribonuclease H family protein [Lachnospiraceae bacterium]|nr:ribonuclease H family protein [Lachnospiraceae bacterium]